MLITAALRWYWTPVNLAASINTGIAKEHAFRSGELAAPTAVKPQRLGWCPGKAAPVTHDGTDAGA
jgi:hypothetical protein